MRETHTCDGDDSAELTDISQPVSNRFALQLTSITKESEQPGVCYGAGDNPIEKSDVLRDYLAAACAHDELHMTQAEWGTATPYLSTIDKPQRRTTNEHKPKIGESRSSDSYGHNTDVLSSLRNKRPDLSGRPHCKGVAIEVARRCS